MKLLTIDEPHVLSMNALRPIRHWIRGLKLSSHLVLKWSMLAKGQGNFFHKYLTHIEKTDVIQSRLSFFSLLKELQIVPY